MSEKPPPIKLHAHRLVAENLRFELFFDHIEAPDGQQVEKYLVVAPRVKTDQLVTGVSVFPIWEGKVGLVQVYRHPLRAYCWELPRGFIDEGEMPEVSALRELEEETGLTCRPEDLQSLGLYAPEAGTLAARVHLFLARHCTRKSEFSAEEFGHHALQFFTLGEIDTLIESGEIQEPGALIAYYRYKNHV
ncbi:MAG: NUDIX hydrolase [Hydrogenophilales bacterium]|nr:NUDIX hydrolase [Hydrogenophilales bacterium]